MNNLSSVITKLDLKKTREQKNPLPDLPLSDFFYNPPRNTGEHDVDGVAEYFH